jgi:hypothetical protein
VRRGGRLHGVHAKDSRQRARPTRPPRRLKLPVARQRRVAREVAPDAIGQRVDDLALVGRVAQLGFSSSGLEMNAVSTRMLGMSGAFSTAKPACSTRRLCSRPTRPMRCSTSVPTFRLSLICAVVLMSSIARSTCASFTDRTLTPPTWSAAFSRLAIQRAALLLAAPVDSA